MYELLHELPNEERISVVNSNILLIWCCKVLMTVRGTHTEAVLNKLTKPELIQLLRKTEATLGKLLICQRKLRTLLLVWKSWKQILLSLGLLTTGLWRRFPKLKGSAAKTSSIPNETLWKLLAFLFLLVIVSLRKRAWCLQKHCRWNWRRRCSSLSSLERKGKDYSQICQQQRLSPNP